MKSPRLKKLRYKIHDRFIGFMEVDGFAIDSDIPVRLCVHQTDSGFWKCDHFDSGGGIAFTEPTRDQAVKHGIEYVRKGIEDGRYAEAVAAWNKEMIHV
jgi:hypothetical protein